MIMYHSGMESINDVERKHYKKINVMTTFYSFLKGKKPKLILMIRKMRKRKSK